MSDYRQFWLMYKTGALAEMGLSDMSMGLEDFKTAFAQEVMTSYEAAWALQADSKKFGFGTIGVQFGFLHHPKYGIYMNGGGLFWVPYATPRKKLEVMVNYFDKIRRDLPFMAFCRGRHRKFFETIATHGLLRCVGVSYNFGKEPMYMFETKEPR